MNANCQNQMLKDFLKHQMMKPVSTVPGPQSSEIMNLKTSTPAAAKAEVDLDYIIAKKPTVAKVRKYIQGMIDEIVAEQED
jgi:hypothetical protein